MDLIDRYLQNVKLALPKAQQTDVIRELTDEILSQVEDKESALGRPLTEAEQVAMLKQLGHPMMLAARYRKQQYLVGPAIFPIYWLVLRLLIVVVLFAMSMAAIAIAATSQSLGAAIRVLAQFPVAAITTFAWVTLVFALMERFEAKFNLFAKWDPRTLPRISRIGKRPTTVEAAAAVFFSALFGVWWLVGLKHQFLIFGPGVNFMHFGSVWQPLYPLFVVLVIIEIVRHTVTLLRPGWENVQFGLRTFVRAANLFVLYVLFNASNVLVLVDGADRNLQPVQAALNKVLHLGLLVAGVVTLAQLAWELYRYFFRDAGDAQRATASS